jgi:NAD/NADP transhydrogenase beta subunit
MPRSSKITTVVSGSVVGVLATSRLAQVTVIAVVALLGSIVGLVGVGVVLSAVWSRRPQRRKAARDVLVLVLNVVHPGAARR